MNKMDLWERAIKTYLAGTAGDIEHDDIEVLALMFKEYDKLKTEYDNSLIIYNKENEKILNER